jgi:multiple sugar transport system permease protein
MPVLILSIMFLTVDSFRKFESILILTAGGPGDVTTTINYLAYNTGIYFLRFADASVMVVIMVALMLGISLGLIALHKRVAE